MRHTSFFFFGVVFLLLLGACSEDRDETSISKIRITDEQSVLNPNMSEMLDTLSLSGKYLYTIRAVDSVDSRLIAMAADDFFAADTELHPNSDDFEKYGVYLFVSKHPSLVQMRVGSELALPARWSGITAGSDYIEIQNMAADGQRVQAVMQFIAKAESELPPVTELSGFKKFIMNNFTTFLSDEALALSMPSENFYGDYILKTALKLRTSQMATFGGLWLGYFLIFGAAFVVIWLLNQLLFSLILRKAAESVKSIGKEIVAFLTGFFFAVPAVGSAMLMSGARLEDQIMLRETGISGLDKIGIRPDLYNEPTAWYLAILVFAVYLVKAVLAHPEWIVKFTYSPEKQRADFYTFRKNDPLAAFKQSIQTDAGRSDEDSDEFAFTPYTHLLKKHSARSLYFAVIITFAAYFFIPKAFVLAALYFWLLALSKNIFGWFKFVLSDDSFEPESDSMIQDLNEKLKAEPGDSEVLSQRADLYLESGKFEEAISDYNELIKADSENHHYYFQKASALDSLERYDDALDALEKAEKLGAKQSAVMNNRALIFQKTGKIREAIAEYDKLTAADAKWWLPFYNRATCYHALDEFEKAAEDYAKAAKLNPDDTDINLNRAQALVKSGRIEEAAKEYGSVIKQNRTDAESLYQRAALYMQLQRYAAAENDYDAIEEIHKEVEAYSHIADVYRNRARARQLQNRFKAAAEDYTRLIELENKTEHYAKRAFMYIKTKDYDRAMEDANKALAFESNQPDLLLLRGSLFEQKGDISSACRDFKKALETGKVKQPEILEFVKKNCKDF